MFEGKNLGILRRKVGGSGERDWRPRGATGGPSGEGHLEAVLELKSCQLSFVACAIFTSCSGFLYFLEQLNSKCLIHQGFTFNTPGIYLSLNPHLQAL